MNETHEKLYIEIQAKTPTTERPTDPRHVISDNMKPEINITPEQWAKFAAAVKEAVEMINELLRQSVENIKRAWRLVAYRANEWIEAQMYLANDNPRWWHLYKHAKKYRTRKKYRRLLMEQMLRKRAAAR